MIRILVVASLLIFRISAHAQNYTYSFMGEWVFPRSAPNDSDGAVAGLYNPSGSNSRALRWSIAGGVVLLNTDVDDPHAIGNGINDLDDVVGTMFDGGDETPALWPATGGIQHLDTLGGEQAIPFTINNVGKIVGAATTVGTANTHAVYWNTAGTITDLGTYTGTSAYVADANDAGQMVGAYLSGSFNRPLMWDASDDPHEPGMVSGFDGGVATAINESGQVVVSMYDEILLEQFHTPYIWTEDDGYTAIPIPDGFDTVFAIDINNNGDVLMNAFNVGFPPSEIIAYVFKDGQLIELPTPDGFDTAFYAGLNDLGWVSGHAMDFEDEIFGSELVSAEGFIIHLPEPSSVSVLLVSLVLLRRSAATRILRT